MREIFHSVTSSWTKCFFEQLLVHIQSTWANRKMAWPGGTNQLSVAVAITLDERSKRILPAGGRIPFQVVSKRLHFFNHFWPIFDDPDGYRKWMMLFWWILTVSIVPLPVWAVAGVIDLKDRVFYRAHDGLGRLGGIRPSCQRLVCKYNVYDYIPIGVQLSYYQRLVLIRAITERSTNFDRRSQRSWLAMMIKSQRQRVLRPLRLDWTYRLNFIGRRNRISSFLWFVSITTGKK
jgi:hypothetical protein